MNLPQNKKLIRVDYTYEDGERYFLDGKNLENFEINIGSASSLSVVHGVNFKPVSWRKVEK